MANAEGSHRVILSKICDYTLSHFSQGVYHLLVKNYWDPVSFLCITPKSELLRLRVFMVHSVQTFPLFCSSIHFRLCAAPIKLDVTVQSFGWKNIILFNSGNSRGKMTFFPLVSSLYLSHVWPCVIHGLQFVHHTLKAQVRLSRPQLANLISCSRSSMYCRVTCA